MATPKEIDRELTERLYELLMIKKSNPGIKIKRLDSSIGRVKACMTKENIVWVEQQVNENDHD